MAEYTSKKFLDQAGLKHVFEKIKANYGSLTDVNGLKDAVEEINKKISNWKASSEQDFKTIFEVIETLNQAITIIEGDITIINGDDNTNGSFKKAIKDAVDNLTTVINASKTTIQKGENEHLTITSESDSSTSAVTYTIDLVDVASASGLTAVDERVSTLETNVGNAIVGAKYNAETKAIDFTTGTGSTISIDAKPFIKDGMVESVEVSDGNLVITFNTFENEPTHTTITVPIDDIFKADDYYTKEEIEEKDYVQYSPYIEGRKTIQLKNYDSISGILTTGGGVNLAMVSKWDVADFGSTQLPINLNGSKARPTYNDDKDIALLEDVESAYDLMVRLEDSEIDAAFDEAMGKPQDEEEEEEKD